VVSCKVHILRELSEAGQAKLQCLAEMDMPTATDEPLKMIDSSN
jgi:hypothetical protein